MRLTVPGAMLAGFVLIRATEPFASPVVQLTWVAGGLLCLVSLRWGAAAVSVTAWYIVTGPYFANHLLFIAWTAATFAIFTDDAQRRLVVRWQLTILYGFTAISKLTPLWLSGEPLGSIVAEGHGIELPTVLLVLGAIGGLLTETFLAVALWIRRVRSYVLVVGAVAHLSFWLAIAPPLEFAWALLSFNGLAYGLLVWSTARRGSPDHAREWSLVAE